MNKKILTQTSLAVSAGLLLTACSSMHREDASYNEASTSYAANADMETGFQEGSGANNSQNYRSSQSNEQSDQEEIIIPLHEEQLNVGKQSVSAGQVTIRKIVTTETVNQPVQLRRERVVIEREGTGGQISSSSDRSFGAASQNGSESVTAESGTASAGSRSTVSSEQAPATASTSASTTASGSAQNQAQINNSDSSTERSLSAGTTDAGVSASASTSSEKDTASSADLSANEPAGAAPEYNSTANNANETKSYSGSTSRSSSSETQNQNFSGNNASSRANSGSVSGNAFQEKSYTIQLREEQPVIQKNVVQTGRVVARKNATWQQQSVQQQVRKEDVQIDKGANSNNVEVRGDFNTSGSSINEPSGAQRPAATHDAELNGSIDSGAEVETKTRSGKARNDDPNTLDDINKGSNTRGGAEDLQDFDEKANDPK